MVKVLSLFSKPYLRDQGTQDIYGSRDATRIAFSVGLIEDGDSWMDMIKDCNQTSHTYNKVTAKAIAENITTRFGKKSTKEL